MICPRCGNEWDATKGACTHCGFVIRTAGQSGTFPGFSNSPQRSSQQSGGLSGVRQAYGGTPPVNRQSGGLSTQIPPGAPRTMRQTPWTPVPPVPGGSTLGSNIAPSSSDGTLTKPAFEKNTLRRMSDGREQGQGMPQTGTLSTDSLSLRDGVQRTPSSTPANRSADYQQQRRPQMPSQGPMPSQARTHQFPQEPITRNTSNQQMSRPVNSFQQAANTFPPMRSNVMTLPARPLLPGVLLRGGRYRLQELQERQDWLSGVFEAIWIGKDAHRGGSQVTICEVVLPETTSVMTQTMLRTATMSLASVGRHPRIPTLWDAFSDQGRSFFVFEPVEGESLMTRMRHSGRALPEQEVIECCLQMTDVLDLLAQQSPQLVHGLIRPEHIIASRNVSQYILTNFSVVLAGGATQYITGVERSRLSSYTAPEFIRGVVDVRTDMYSLIATAYHAVTGSVPTGISGSIPQAQRINPGISSAFDAILTKGLRAVANQRYQRPSELRQDLLAMRSVNGSLVSGNGSNVAYQNNAPSFVTRNGQRTDSSMQRTADHVAEALPLLVNSTDNMEERVSLLPNPEDLPPMKEANDTLNATVLLCLILVSLIVIVVMSHMMA
jgi:serine/threonine protein kinase